MSWWKKEQPKSVGADAISKKTASILVYRALDSSLTHYTGLSVWLSHNYEPSYWEPIFAAAEKSYAEVRHWAQELPCGNIRSEYLQWLTYYYDWGLKSARKELSDQHIKRSQEEYDRSRVEAEAEADVAPQIPKPW